VQFYTDIFEQSNAVLYGIFCRLKFSLTRKQDRGDTFCLLPSLDFVDHRLHP